MPPDIQPVHIFTMSFERNEDALAFGHPHWEPEPGDDVPDEEYSAWEARNPIWPMKAELGYYLDSDFIEVVWNGGHHEAEPDWNYLLSRLRGEDVEAIRAVTPPRANTLVLIDQQALGGFDAEPGSTLSMHYCGAYLPLR